MLRVAPLRLIAIGALLAALALDLHAFLTWQPRDAGTYYYGARCLLHGRNPFDNATLVAEWRADETSSSTPILVKRMGLPTKAFIGLPSIALLVAPAALLPQAVGLFALAVLAFAALLGSIWLMTRVESRPWTTTARLLFAAGVLALPSVHEIVYLGQTSTLPCLLLAASLVLARRGRPVAAGLCLSLSLAKPTFTLPHLLIYACKRQWKIVATCIAAFAVVNFLILARFGASEALRDWFALIQLTGSPAGINFPGDGNRFGQRYALQMVHLERLLYALLGPASPWRTPLLIILSTAVVVALVAALRPVVHRGDAALHPLESAAAMAAALILVYHRSYDLVALMFVAHGLIDYRLNWPNRVPRAWSVAVILTVALALSVRWILPLYRYLPVSSHTQDALGRVWIAPALALSLYAVTTWMLWRDRCLSAAQQTEAAVAGVPGDPQTSVVR